MLLFTLPQVLYGFSKKQFRRTLIYSGVIGVVVGGFCDYMSVNWLKLWSFNPDTLIGVWFFGLPLEEWMFFPLVSMSVTTVSLSIAKKQLNF